MQRKISATWLKDRIQNPNAPILHCLKLNQFKFQKGKFRPIYGGDRGRVAQVAKRRRLVIEG